LRASTVRIFSRDCRRREDLHPAVAHRLESEQARALRVDADDVVVLRPHRHHARKVGALERLVEGGLGVLGVG
jgi:hypothetical protein